MQSGQVFSPCNFLIAILTCVIAVVPATFAQTPTFQGVFAGLSLEIADQSVPPGGTLQVQVLVTEPKQIKKGRQGMQFSGPQLSSLTGGSLFSPAGDVSGVAVDSNGNTEVNVSSPLSSFGNTLDIPVMVFTRQ